MQGVCVIKDEMDWMMLHFVTGREFVQKAVSVAFFKLEERICSDCHDEQMKMEDVEEKSGKSTSFVKLFVEKGNQCGGQFFVKSCCR